MTSLLNDENTTVQKLKLAVKLFRDERDWLKYDTPRNLAVSLSIEAAELLEHFQWKSDKEVEELGLNRKIIGEISNELADVVIYCLGFSDTLGIDLSQALYRKLEKNSKKYSVERGITTIAGRGRGLGHRQYNSDRMGQGTASGSYRNRVRPGRRLVERADG